MARRAVLADLSVIRPDLDPVPRSIGPLYERHHPGDQAADVILEREADGHARRPGDDHEVRSVTLTTSGTIHATANTSDEPGRRARRPAGTGAADSDARSARYGKVARTSQIAAQVPATIRRFPRTGCPGGCGPVCTLPAWASPAVAMPSPAQTRPPGSLLPPARHDGRVCGRAADEMLAPALHEPRPDQHRDHVESPHTGENERDSAAVSAPWTNSACRTVQRRVGRRSRQQVLVERRYPHRCSLASPIRDDRPRVVRHGLVIARAQAAAPQVPRHPGNAETSPASLRR